MPPTGSNYERELKGLLQGEPESLDRYTRALSASERSRLRDTPTTPFLVVRAAGSFGFDLVALRSEFAFPVEVKASSSDTIHFSAASGRADKQLYAHRRTVERVGLIVVYAYRRLGHRGGDPWRLYATGTSRSAGRSAFLLGRLPPVETTREGNAVLRWESGLPLSRFLELVSLLTTPVAAPAA
ncbi:MAG: Holliday junction resolvase [Thermoplasmata archaeon]|nr:Holliday junction resolvase [Thermoplasmata archaeon]MCI4358897.1 Holliday junction resolvase [Thermoplasmata archaeon]